MSPRSGRAVCAAAATVLACGGQELFAPEILRDQLVTFAGHGDLFGVTADGANVENLTRHPEPAEIGTLRHQWSARGDRVAFISRHGVGVWEFTTGEATLLSGGVVTAIPPVWSPDGEQIAFRALRNTLWTVDRSGAHSQQIVDEAVTGSLSWSPASRIALELTAGSGEPSDIYVVNPDGTGLTNLTHTPDAWEWRPQWSPDGQHIAFLSSVGLEVMTSSGANRTLLTPDTLWVQHHRWSPDGTRLAVTGWYNDNADIYVVDAVEAEVHRLTYHDAADYEPAWIFDAWIAFQSDRSGYYEIHVMNADGSAQTQLTELRSR